MAVNGSKTFRHIHPKSKCANVPAASSHVIMCVILDCRNKWTTEHSKRRKGKKKKKQYLFFDNDDDGWHTSPKWISVVFIYENRQTWDLYYEFRRNDFDCWPYHPESKTQLLSIVAYNLRIIKFYARIELVLSLSQESSGMRALRLLNRWVS